MANPFLVLGGIAVGIITAAAGVLAVPGWVASAQDASAVHDLDQVKNAQAAASTGGSFVTDKELAALPGLSLTRSAGVATCTTRSEDGKEWAAVSKSPSGRYFATLQGQAMGSGPTQEAAVDAATGELSDELSYPMNADGTCAPALFEPMPLGPKVPTDLLPSLGSALIYNVDGLATVEFYGDRLRAAPDGTLRPTTAVRPTGSTPGFSVRRLSQDSRGNLYSAANGWLFKQDRSGVTTSWKVEDGAFIALYEKATKNVVYITGTMSSGITAYRFDMKTGTSTRLWYSTASASEMTMLPNGNLAGTGYSTYSLQGHVVREYDITTGAVVKTSLMYTGFTWDAFITPTPEGFAVMDKSKQPFRLGVWKYGDPAVTWFSNGPATPANTPPVDGPVGTATMNPWLATVGPDGTVYFEEGAHYLRQIKDGVVTTVASRLAS